MYGSEFQAISLENGRNSLCFLMQNNMFVNHSNSQRPYRTPKLPTINYYILKGF